MWRRTVRHIKRFAAAGAVAMFAGGLASAGLLCDWQTQHARPYYNPSSEPNWGFYETNWRRISPPQFSHQGGYCADSNVLPTNSQVFVQQGQPGQAIVIQGQPVPSGSYPTVPIHLQYSTPSPNVPQSYSAPTFAQPGTPLPQTLPSPVMNLPLPSGPQPNTPGSVGIPLPITVNPPQSNQPSTILPRPAGTAPTQGVNPVPMPMNELPPPMPVLPNQSSNSGLRLNPVSQSRLVFGRSAQLPVYQQELPSQAPAYWQSPQNPQPATYAPQESPGIANGQTSTQSAPVHGRRSLFSRLLSSGK